jgi:hypothetical protein
VCYPLLLTLLSSLTTYNISRKQFSASDFSRSLRDLGLTPSAVSHALFNHDLPFTKPLVLAGLDSIIGCNAIDYFCSNSGDGVQCHTGPQACISQGITSSISAWNGIYYCGCQKDASSVYEQIAATRTRGNRVVPTSQRETRRRRRRRHCRRTARTY